MEMKNRTKKKKGHESEEAEGSNDMFSNLFLLFFGSGTFSVPWGFARAGLFGGALGVFGVALLTYLTINMLVKAKRLQMKRLPKTSGHDKDKLQRSLSYAAIATYAIGSPKAGYLVKLSTTLSTVGACGGYLIFVVGLLLPIIQHFGSFGFDNLDETSVMLMLLPILIPLTWIRSFRGLAYVSAFGNFVFIGSVFAVLYNGWTRFGFPVSTDFVEGGGYLRLWPESASSYTLFISPCIFLFTIHYCALPIEAEGHKASSSTKTTTQCKNEKKSFTPSTPLSSSLRYLYEPSSSSQNSSANPTLLETSTNELMNHSPSSLHSFDMALLFALIASAIMNCVFGACSYVLFGRANHPPHTSEGFVSGCDAHQPYMCDNVVKNLSPGPLEVMVSVGLILNIMISYVLMLAPSRQYVEAAVLTALSHRFPSTFSCPNCENVDDSETESGREEEEDAFSSEEPAQIEVLDSGEWVAGKDNWPRAFVRNLIRTILVLFTAKVALTVPHFALITGLIGGMTDSLQSLVLPPIVYIFETVKSASSIQLKRRVKNSLGNSYASIQPVDRDDEDDDKSTSGMLGFLKKVELGLCGLLAVGGLGFIVFATNSNIRAIEHFL